MIHRQKAAEGHMTCVLPFLLLTPLIAIHTVLLYMDRFLKRFLFLPSTKYTTHLFILMISSKIVDYPDYLNKPINTT